MEPVVFLLQGNSANHCATPIQFGLTEFRFNYIQFTFAETWMHVKIPHKQDRCDGRRGEKNLHYIRKKS